MRTAFGWHFGYVNIRALNHEDSVLYFPPEAFGPFKVFHQIGAGALGPVFRAYESGRDRLVAVKVFRLDLTPDQSATLVREFEQLIARDIQHAAIAAPIAAGLEGGAPFLAEEYAVGDSLDVYCREHGPLPLPEALRLVTFLADGIDAAADRGVAHGALHPRDILVSGDAARITGFGIAAALKSAGLRVPMRPPYSDPVAPSDVYALAAIAFEAISGKRLTAASLSEMEDENLRDVFAEALAANPAERPARARDFASMLVAAAPAVAVAPAPPPIAEVPPLVTPPPIEVDVLDDLPLEQANEPSLELEPGTRRAWIPLVLLVSILAAAVVLGYGAWRARRAAPAPAAEIRQERSVSETTVDVPTAAQPPALSTPAPVPANEPRKLPAPSPSRPAAGVATKTSARGVLLIRSNPPNVDVAVNGQPRGKTPITMRDLPLGSYTIRVAREGLAPDERRVDLTARRSMAAVSFTMRPAVAPRAQPPAATEKPAPSAAGSINVQSRPEGARVYVNDRLVGTTPLAIPDVPAGPATVRIDMDGYQPWTTTIVVPAGEPARVNASLDRR
jgi:serine/threonine protein kinase